MVFLSVLFELSWLQELLVIFDQGVYWLILTVTEMYTIVKNA